MEPLETAGAIEAKDYGSKGVHMVTNCGVGVFPEILASAAAGIRERSASVSAKTQRVPARDRTMVGDIWGDLLRSIQWIGWN